MTRILPVHEAHICWPMHHHALILPPVPPLTKKHHQAVATSGHRGRWEAAATLVAHRLRRSGGKLRLVSPRHRPLLPPPPLSLLPPPLPAAAAAATMDGGRSGWLQAESQAAEAGSRALVAGFPPPRRRRPSLWVFGSRHRHLMPDFKARRCLNLPVRSAA
jgi:hypothetical protein